MFKMKNWESSNYSGKFLRDSRENSKMNIHAQLMCFSTHSYNQTSLTIEVPVCPFHNILKRIQSDNNGTNDNKRLDRSVSQKPTHMQVH
jgi:hypothetical protein